MALFRILPGSSITRYKIDFRFTIAKGIVLKRVGVIEMMTRCYLKMDAYKSCRPELGVLRKPQYEDIGRIERCT